MNLRLTETVPVDRVYKLLTADYDLKYDTVRELLKFVASNGSLEVNYTYGSDKNGKKNTCGRLFANKGLQRMSNEARYFLLGDDYLDLDFVNSNPRILWHLAKANGVHESKRVNLQAYCTGGRERLMANGLPDIKDWMREICNDPFRWSDRWCEVKKNLSLECRSICEVLQEKYKEFFVKDCQEDEKTFMAKLLFSKEAELLEDLRGRLTRKGVEVVTLCFDGCIVKKNNSVAKVLEDFNKSYEDFSCIVKPWRKYPDFKYIATDCWDYTDPVKFADLNAKLGLAFSSKESAFYHLYRDLLKTVRSIHWKIFYIKNNDPLTRHDLIKSSNFKEYTYKKRREIKGTEMEMDAPLVELMKITPMLFNFNQIDYFEKKPESFCLFSGFIPDLYPREIPDNYLELIEPILHHLLVVWSVNDVKVYDWLINYFAFIVQKAPSKSEAIVIFTGDEGTGKSMILDWLMDTIFGHMAFVITGSDKLTRNFNQHLAGKLIVCMEELKGTGDDYRHDSNRIKQLTTGKWLDIERKGVDVVQILNTMNIIGFSNYKNPLGACKGIKRRLFIQEVSDIYKGNSEYFRKLAKELKNPLLGHCFLKMLRDHVVDEDLLRFGKPNTMAKSKSVFQALTVVEKCLYIHKVVQSQPDYSGEKDLISIHNIESYNDACFQSKITNNFIGRALGDLKLPSVRKSSMRYRDFRNYNFEEDILKVAEEEAGDMGLIDNCTSLLD